MAVLQIESLPDFQERIDSADANRLIIVDFYADWCGPCRHIAPVFIQLSKRFSNASFFKINVDHSFDIMQQYGIRAMPTFVLIKAKREVERIQGANSEALEQAINRHYSDTPQNPNAANPLEKIFLQQFVTKSFKVQYYADEVYKTLALSLIPIEKLRVEATSNDGVLSMFHLAEGLLNWFKTNFFTWCDTPSCESCGVKTVSGKALSGSPTIEESQSGADRVEIYACACGQEVRFPRYNDPAKLLETRKGRCGEWANCFTLIAAAVGFDVRFIYDVTDHVWTELWIPEYDTWMHCDPCENLIDRPLIYEKGWGKKLSYIIAFGLDHVHDVTWRYSRHHREVITRRTSVREPVLANFLAKLNNRMGRNISIERTNELKRRRQHELIQFIVVGKQPSNDEQYGGRTSGDLKWREARGELGFSPKKKSIVLRPNDKELASKKFILEYNCVSDMYIRGDIKVKGWAAYVQSSKGIQRKVEHDWKVAYLCRKEDKGEGEGEGEITWSVDLSGVKAKSAYICLRGIRTFEEASISVVVCADKEICMILPNHTGELILDNLPSTLLKITASFSGGCGNNAFQHAQLFRASLDSVEPQLKIDIEFE